MSIFNHIGLLAFIIGVVLLVGGSFVLVFGRSVQDSIDSAYQDGYNAAVKDITESGQLIDKDGNTYYINLEAKT